MNSILVKVFAFFIGLFITLIIISFTRINEPFTNFSSSLLTPLTHKIKDGIMKYIDDNIDDIKNKNDDSILPYKGYKFMCINTYDNIDTISANDGKWYDIDSSLNYIEYNYNNYFKFSKLINLEHNKVNNKTGVKGGDISSIQLSGPSCFNFANNNETYELTEFTMFMTMKYISCHNTNNILFEMTGNTTTVNNIIPEYKTSIIHINIILNENKNYKIRVIVGDTIYEKPETNNIDKDIIENSNYYIIGLYYTTEKIGLIFNDKLYEYENVNKFKITLGSTPIIINKNGSLNMHLYNFVYYKSLFNFNEYDYLIRYNNYYISGLYAKECAKIENTANTEIKKDNELKPIDDIAKITLPKFTYPILHKNKDDEEDDEDEDNKKDLKTKIKDFVFNKDDDEEDDEDNKKDLKTKIKDFINKDNNKDNNEEEEDENEKPNIFKRMFGF